MCREPVLRVSELTCTNLVVVCVNILHRIINLCSCDFAGESGIRQEDIFPQDKRTAKPLIKSTEKVLV